MSKILKDDLLLLKKQTGKRLKDLSVMSPELDPYRLDTPANRRNAEWFREGLEACNLLGRQDDPIHNRGAFYAVLVQGNVFFPGGTTWEDENGIRHTTFVNNNACWKFFEATSSVARWLDYIEFADIFDARNSPPVIRWAEDELTAAKIALLANDDLPSVDELRPSIDLTGFTGRQDYRLAIFGEKTSLNGVLGPISERYNTDLYLPSGEISNTQLETMARVGYEDGRELVVFIVADCDPAGYQMAVSVAHKLRALADSKFYGFRFQLIAPTLTVGQVHELDLPSTPLKESELRAAGWKKKHGVEQTEIDALATLQPETLTAIMHQAIAPYFDSDLDRRVDSAREAYLISAQSILDEVTDEGPVSEHLEQAEANLSVLRDAMSQARAAIDDLDVEFPEFEIPEPELDVPPEPLISSDMDLLEHITILKDRKDYSIEGRDDDDE